MKTSINWIKQLRSGLKYLHKVPLSAFGDTPEEAVTEVKIAAEGYIEKLKEDGEQVPEPQKMKKYSGQTRLRLPSSLHEKLVKEAERKRVSLNTYMIYLLSGSFSISMLLKQMEDMGKGRTSDIRFARKIMT